MKNKSKKNGVLRKISILVLVLSLALSSCRVSRPPEKENNEPDTSLKILLIGSSYFSYHNLAEMLSHFFTDRKKDVYLDTAVQPGLYLADHVDRDDTRTKINEKKWDYVVLQGVGTLMAYPDIFTHHPVYPALISLRDTILANHSSTKIVFCLPWAFEDGMAWKEGWTDLYPEMQQKIYDNTLKYAEEIGLVIAPVGWAWNYVLMEKDYPLHYLHMSDWNHPSLKGSYLMACVIYATVFRERTTGIEYYADIPEDEAAYFQEVGSDIVLDNLELWNII
mgnify:CR=1 FL=1